jgi:hypothetical protein
MAIVVSVLDTTQVTASSTTVANTTANSDASAGDLLITVLQKDGNSTTTTQPTGWTKLIGNTCFNQAFFEVWYKEAVTADESASTYTWGTDNESWIAVLCKVTGADTTPVSLIVTSQNSATPGTATTTASSAASTIFAGVGGNEDSTPNTLDSAITTSLFNDVSDSGNGECFLLFGHYEEGSTTIPALTHALNETIGSAAFVFEVKEAETGTIVTADTGSITLAGITAGISAATAILATTAALTFAPIDATVSAGTNVTSTTGALTLAPINATITANTFITSTTGALTLAPIDATVTVAVSTEVTSTTGALTLVPINAAVSAGTNVTTRIGPELVTNGDMESGTTGWIPQGDADLSVETTIVHSGAQSLQVTKVTDNNAAQSTTTVIGRRYSVEAWLYLTDAAANGYLYAGTSAYAADIWSDITTTKGSWVKLSGVFKAVGTTTYIGFGLTT